jgi:hypothetical protein
VVEGSIDEHGEIEEEGGGSGVWSSETVFDGGWTISGVVVLVIGVVSVVSGVRYRIANFGLIICEEDCVLVEFGCFVWARRLCVCNA